MQKEGFLLINKPAATTSFSCVRYIKKLLKKTKVGHSGILDSFATGLIIIGIGRPATRLMHHLLHFDKVYEAQGKLGELTDTFDPRGRLIKKIISAMITQEQLAQALQLFEPGYEQVPPAYSALRYRGARLYELTQKKTFSEDRLQEILYEKKRSIRCYSLQLLSFTFPLFSVRTHVSHGTYIRSLINDVAQKLQSCATTVSLKRKAIGPFCLNEALDLSCIKELSDLEGAMLSVDEVQQRIKAYQGSRLSFL